MVQIQQIPVTVIGFSVAVNGLRGDKRHSKRNRTDSVFNDGALSCFYKWVFSSHLLIFQLQKFLTADCFHFGWTCINANPPTDVHPLSVTAVQHEPTDLKGEEGYPIEVKLLINISNHVLEMKA